LLSDCGILAAGSVDADALPTSESPSAVAAAALVVLFSLAACFIRAMVVFLDTLLGSVDITGVACTAYECEATQAVLFPRVCLLHSTVTGHT
jgi:hypothetical protein